MELRNLVLCGTVPEKGLRGRKEGFWAEVRSGNIGLSANYLNFTDLTDCRYLDRKLAEMMDRKVIQTVTYAPNLFRPLLCAVC